MAADDDDYLARMMAMRYMYDDDDDYDDSYVEFLRPDGDIEGKDVPWCLDNGFFQVRDGLWSGPWYYDDHPEERPMHRQRLRETEEIERNMHARASRVLRADREREAEMAMEEALLCDILQNDIARQLYGRNSVNDTDGERSRRRQQNTSSTEEAIGGLGLQFSSLLGLNETQRKAAKPAASPKQQQTSWTDTPCKKCNKQFRTMFLALDHMKKCCPNKLMDGIKPKNFKLDTCTYKCMLCHEVYAEEDECMNHFESCLVYKQFDTVEPDTFIRPYSKRRFLCKACNAEFAKWNKCLEHMGYCCPDVIFK